MGQRNRYAVPDEFLDANTAELSCYRGEMPDIRIQYIEIDDIIGTEGQVVRQSVRFLVIKEDSLPVLAELKDMNIRTKLKVKESDSNDK
jgi:hypothetical protein